MELKIVEFPGERILPTGYNITIACVSNSSRKNPSYYDKPFWIQFYFNDIQKMLYDCGGGDGMVDSEASKACKFHIINATKNNSGIYSCWSWNQIYCAKRKIQIEFRGKLCFRSH